MDPYIKMWLSMMASGFCTFNAAMLMATNPIVGLGLMLIGFYFVRAVFAAVTATSSPQMATAQPSAAQMELIEAEAEKRAMDKLAALYRAAGR